MSICQINKNLLDTLSLYGTSMHFGKKNFNQVYKTGPLGAKIQCNESINYETKEIIDQFNKRSETLKARGDAT